ncbi:hypothetical protein [Streptomyces stackebrandtii]|uniref:hypothetical protein n=1 Tax=Streptomyces stackebrandtii TaxID=3051177 RepID=UPI0028DBE9E2|nr:hypothetical protein [Streptomyces sp. DSM 40976]
MNEGRASRTAVHPVRYIRSELAVAWAAQDSDTVDEIRDDVISDLGSDDNAYAHVRTDLECVVANCSRCPARSAFFLSWSRHDCWFVRGL